MYRHWDHYVESIQHPFIADVELPDYNIQASALIDILEGEPYECPMEPFGSIEQLAWSNDSKLIAYTCRKKTGLAYSISTDSDIYLYNTGTRETKNLCKPTDYQAPETDPTRTLKTQSVNSEENLKNLPGYDQNPKFSPDGRYVAWLSMSRDGYESDRQRLCRYDLTTGEKIGVVPYGGTVGVEFFNKDGWAIIIWGSVGEAKVRQEYLVKKNPGKYVGPTDGQGNVLTDTVLGSQTVEGLNKQYAALRYVDSYSVVVVPDTRTGTARFRWAPSKNSTLIAQLPANYELTVLAASSNWIMAQDPTSGKIGYIAAKYTAAK
jgi:dipeptidyl aminopeptidase/acylaminoacyl peptidase